MSRTGARRRHSRLLPAAIAAVAVAAVGLAAWQLTTATANRNGSSGALPYRFRVVDPGFPYGDFVVAGREDSLWLTVPDGLARLRSGAWETYENPDWPIGQVQTSVVTPGDGSVWVGGSNGLARFQDGSWTIVSPPGFSVEGSVPGNVLAASDSGDVWGILNGYGVFRKSRDGISYFTPSDAVLDPLPDVVLTGVAVGSDGTVWVGTYGQGVAQLREPTAWTTHTTGNGNQNIVYSLAVGPDGSVWTGTLEGIGRLRDGQWTMYKPDDGPTPEVTSITVASDGTVWAGTPGGGLVRLQDGDWTTYTTADGLPDDRVTSVAVTSNGTVGVVTTGGLAIGSTED